MGTVTKDMTVMDVLRMDQGAAAVFLSFGLQCLGWPGATMESLEDASRVHGINVDNLVAELNRFFESK